MITIKHLKKQYELATPFSDINVTINDGDVISIIGPSGTGKSTFLRCINRLETPTAGEIYVDGLCVTDKKSPLEVLRKKVGMVFQSFNLFPNLTVIENVMYAPMHLLKQSKEEARDNALQLLDSVGMKSRALSFPDELSGGQKQRVAIARTLAMNPDVILLDEPTSALDPTMVGEVEEVIAKLAKSGKTMLIVTHSMSLAKNISNRIFYMDKGGIYEDGSPDQIFNHPLHERTKAFIEQLKVYTIVVENQDLDITAALRGLKEFEEMNAIPMKVREHMDRIMEEIILREILPYLSEETRIRILATYNKNDGSVTLNAYYSGEKIDYDTVGNMDRDDFTSMVAELIQTPLEDDKYTYKLTAKII